MIRKFFKAGRGGWEPARGAAVYVATRGRLAVVPSRIRAGGPIRVLATDVELGLLGEAVEAAIEDSERIDPDLDHEDPISWDELLAGAGLSRRQLAGRRSVRVDEVPDGSIDVAAWRYIRGGWEPIGDHATITLAAPTPEELGHAVHVAAIGWDQLSGSHLSSAI